MQNLTGVLVRSLAAQQETLGSEQTFGSAMPTGQHAPFQNTNPSDLWEVLSAEEADQREFESDIIGNTSELVLTNKEMILRGRQLAFDNLYPREIPAHL